MSRIRPVNAYQTLSTVLPSRRDTYTRRRADRFLTSIPTQPSTVCCRRLTEANIPTGTVSTPRIHSSLLKLLAKSKINEIFHGFSQDLNQIYLQIKKNFLPLGVLTVAWGGVKIQLGKKGSMFIGCSPPSDAMCLQVKNEKDLR